MYKVFKMWGMKAKTLPIIIGALALTKDHMNKSEEAIPGPSTLYTELTSYARHYQGNYTT